MRMERIDKIVFGDNQFFGINHMSQEKAQQLAEKFYDIRNIYKVYDIAFNNGINAVMLNSNDRAKEICNYFRDHKSQYAHISWYPSVPYPHKYANLVAEKGIFSAINEVLFSNNSAMGVLGMVAKGGMAVLGKDAIKLMQMLVDAEFRIYKGLDVKALFLQNIITDLLLGYEMKDIFYEYCEFVRKRYKIIPGLITQNLPFGYLMSPDVKAYVECIRNNDVEKYQIMAMSTLASGAVPAKEAYEFINDLPIQSVVFGASQEKNIRETVHLIQLQ